MTASVIEVEAPAEDYDAYVAAKFRRTLAVRIRAGLIFGLILAVCAVGEVLVVRVLGNVFDSPVPLVEAIDWSNQLRLPVPSTGQETAVQLQASIDRMFYSERNGTEVVKVPQDQEVRVLGKVPEGPYKSYYPAAVNQNWLPIQACTIEKQGLLTEIASDGSRVLFRYSAPGPEFYDPDTPNKCSGGQLIFEQLR